MMKYSIYIVWALFLLPMSIHAASAVVMVDTGKETINALEATINIPKTVSIKEINNGDSMIVFWITQPTYSTSTRSISFAGLTPGGFKGKRAVFSIVGDFKESDLDGVIFSDVRALKNDGEGTATKVKLSISSGETSPDTIVPETFTPILGSTDDVYGGRPFVSFAALDKNTGVEKFESAETFFGRPSDSDWVLATNPYEVKDKTLLKRIYIRATDHNGNYRVESVALPRRLPAEIFLAIIMGALCVSALRYSRRLS